MKKHLAPITIVIALACALFLVSFSKMRLNGGIPITNYHALAQTTARTNQAVQPADPPGTINGAINKELIPDNAAYTVLLRFAAHPPQAKKDFVRSYLKFNRFEDADIEAIQAVCEEFRKRIEVIDNQIEQLSPSTAGKFNQLRKQQDDLVQEFANSFSKRLSPKGQGKMNHLIQNRIKSRIKLSLPDKTLVA